MISIITLFLTSEIVEKQTEENQIKNFTKKFEDEIEPYCKGSLEVTNYKQFSDIESLDINLFDQREWYLNLFNVIKNEGIFIENKYKNRFSGVVLVKFKNGAVYTIQVKSNEDQVKTFIADTKKK